MEYTDAKRAKVQGPEEKDAKEMKKMVKAVGRRCIHSEP